MTPRDCKIGAMKLAVLASLVLLSAACVRDPYALDPMWARDGLYCYHLRADGTWKIKGLEAVCPNDAGKLR
jgi:hypothetical protein